MVDKVEDASLLIGLSQSGPWKAVVATSTAPFIVEAARAEGLLVTAASNDDGDTTERRQQRQALPPVDPTAHHTPAPALDEVEKTSPLSARLAETAAAVLPAPNSARAMPQKVSQYSASSSSVVLSALRVHDHRRLCRSIVGDMAPFICHAFRRCRGSGYCSADNSTK
jgi:hypothetical protein